MDENEANRRFLHRLYDRVRCYEDARYVALGIKRGEGGPFGTYMSGYSACFDDLTRAAQELRSTPPE